MTNFSMMVSALKQNIARAVVGKDDVVELMLTALLCEGHVLIEDMFPAWARRRSPRRWRVAGLHLQAYSVYPRCHPVGYHRLHHAQSVRRMQYRPGAIMNQIVLADEINRTSPKTQSALLEVMEERQVTIDGVTYPAGASPFMVLATQNPVDMVGTYPLPEAQLDRFFMRISIGYPSHAG
ncbi:MAG: AAA family ATPase [Christensenellales bacterium]